MTEPVDARLAAALSDHRAGRLSEAVSAYREILDAQPDNAAAWINIGAAQRAMGNAEDAAASLLTAVELAPDHAGAWLNLGNALIDGGRFDDACRAFATATEHAPDLADAYVNWGEALTRARDAAGAVAVLERGARRCPGHPGILTNLGNALLDAHRAGEALAHLQAAAEAAPNDAKVLRNLGNALRLNGDLEASIDVFDRLSAADPDDADSRCLRAFSLFSLGKFRPAWRDYGARWQSAFHEPRRPFSLPVWRGEDISGRTVLVCGEQAVGDELMFATMLPEMTARCGRLIFETEHRLVPLFRRSLPTVEIVARRDPPARELTARSIDVQVALGDLGRYLRPDRRSFEKFRPYLRVGRGPAAEMRERYRHLAGTRPRVGISWRSGAERAGIARSLDTATLANLLGCQDCWWLSLQYGDPSEDFSRLRAAGVRPPHVDAGVDALKSMDDFATQVAGLDLVVSVANTTVHLAGNLGIPTLALLPHVADWRWRASGEACHWYPSVRLLRQDEAGRWSAVIDRVMAEIRARADGVRSC